MKKIFGLYILLTNLSCLCFSQDELTFKVAYKPLTKYSQTIKTTSFTEVTYSGPDEILKILQERGVQNPTITKAESTTESEFNTGAVTDGVHFPLTMTFIKTISSDGKAPFPDGTVIYGQGSINDMPTMDSIVSTGLSEDYKTNLLQAVRSTFSQISFPEMKLKVGEEFTQEKPLSIPIAGINVEMSITTKYKLISIINRVGNFNIIQTYTLQTTNTEYPIKAIGNGKGSLQYDISNSNYISYQLDTDIDINMELKRFNLGVKSKSGYIQTTIITKN